MKNNLPEFWVVKKDKSHPNWKKVEDYIIEHSKYNDWVFNGQYYGYYGGNNHYNGFGGFYSENTDGDAIIQLYPSNCTLITIEQFVEMIEPKFKKGDKVRVSDDRIKWHDRIFECCNEGAFYPYVTSSGSHWKYCEHRDVEGWIPEFGEIVEFSADGKVWVERIFLGILPKLNRKYIAVQYLSEESFKKNGNYAVSVWAYARKIQEPDPLNVTIEDIAKKFGVDPKQIHIIDK